MRKTREERKALCTFLTAQGEGRENERERSNPFSVLVQVWFDPGAGCGDTEYMFPQEQGQMHARGRSAGSLIEVLTKCLLFTVTLSAFHQSTPS